MNSEAVRSGSAHTSNDVDVSSQNPPTVRSMSAQRKSRNTTPRDATSPASPIDILSHSWAYPSDQIVVVQSEDGVLGRGTFGEVRVASWCGMKVAAKTLHALRPVRDGSLPNNNESGAFLSPEDVGNLLEEFSVLSQLRHPNLVLFLGVTVDASTQLPRAILTELLPHSLYDLLETHKCQLEQHEVLGLARDALHALSFLHSRAIVQ